MLVPVHFPFGSAWKRIRSWFKLAGLQVLGTRIVPNHALPRSLALPRDGMALLADPQTQHDGAVPLYLVNATEASVALWTESGRPLILLEARMPDGSWKRAETPRLSRCGNACFPIELPAGHTLVLPGTWPTTGPRRPVRYRLYASSLIRSSFSPQDGPPMGKDWRSRLSPEELVSPELAGQAPDEAVLRAQSDALAIGLAAGRGEVEELVRIIGRPEGLPELYSAFLALERLSPEQAMAQALEILTGPESPRKELFFGAPGFGLGSLTAGYIYRHGNTELAEVLWISPRYRDYTGVALDLGRLGETQPAWALSYAREVLGNPAHPRRDFLSNARIVRAAAKIVLTQDQRAWLEELLAGESLPAPAREWVRQALTEPPGAES